MIQNNINNSKLQRRIVTTELNNNNNYNNGNKSNNKTHSTSTTTKSDKALKRDMSPFVNKSLCSFLVLFSKCAICPEDLYSEGIFTLY